jgi:hypothetical protein
MANLFIDSLSDNSILLLSNLWYPESIENMSKFTNEDILYLKNSYYKSETIKQFFKYYKTLPVDLQDEKYINSIIYHYKTIYLDFLLYTKKINRRPQYLVSH